MLPFRHEDECSGKSYMLIIKNTLSVPDMDHNIITPFSMREASINARNVPTMYVEDFSNYDYSACFSKENIISLLNLHDAFSYFLWTKKST